MFGQAYYVVFFLITIFFIIMLPSFYFVTVVDAEPGKKPVITEL